MEIVAPKHRGIKHKIFPTHRNVNVMNFRADRYLIRTGRVRRVKRERMKCTRLAKSPHSADFGLSEDFEILSISGKQTLETIA